MGHCYSPLSIPISLKMSAQSNLETFVDLGHKTKMPPSCTGLPISSEGRGCVDTLIEKDGLCGS